MNQAEFERELHKFDPALKLYWNPQLQRYDLFRLYSFAGRVQGELTCKMNHGEFIPVGKVDDLPCYRYRQHGAYIPVNLHMPLGMDQIRTLRMCDMHNPQNEARKRKYMEQQAESKRKDEENAYEARRSDFASSYKWASTINNMRVG